MYTSNVAAMTKTESATKTRLVESKSILLKTCVPNSCLITATDMIPPASPPTKYAKISGMP